MELETVSELARQKFCLHLTFCHVPVSVHCQREELALVPDSGCGAGRSQSPVAAAAAPELLPTLLFCWAVAATQMLPRGG